MEIRKLLTDDDAVSPVIGVILMVAITVILAAVIGAFVLGFGGSTSAAPSASFDTSGDDGEVVEFTHDGGDPINGEYLEWGADASTETFSTPSSWTDGEMTAGNSVSTTNNYATGDTVALIWNDGDSSSTLREHEV